MNYNAVAEKAKKAIMSYGGSCSITRKTNVVYDKATNTYVSDTVTITGSALQSDYDAENIDGTNIMAGDIKLMCVLDGVPKMNDKIVFGSKSFTVLNVNETNPNGGCVLYYILQCRE